MSATEQRERAWVAYGALLIAIAGIAWSAIFIRWSAVPGPSSAFYRVFIAALVLIPWRIISMMASPQERSRVAATTPRALLLALGGGVFFGLDLALYNTSVMRTTATTATLFGNNAPIFVGIGTWIFFRRRPQRRFWAGLALAMTGVAVVMVQSVKRGGFAGTEVSGAMMSLCAAAFFAGYLLTTEHVREEMDTLTFSTLAIASSVATLLVVCLVFGTPLWGFPRERGSRSWIGSDFAARRVSGARLRARPPAGHRDLGRLARASTTDRAPGGAAPGRAHHDVVSDWRRAGACGD